MQKARMLGNYVQNLAEQRHESIDDLCEILDCTEPQMLAFLKGRAYATFAQIKLLANHFGITVGNLLSGDKAQYNATVVHCMNRFQNNNNREEILDIIDEFMDIKDALM